MVLSPPPENALINSLISGGKLPKGKSTMFLVHILDLEEEKYRMTLEYLAVPENSEVLTLSYIIIC